MTYCQRDSGIINEASDSLKGAVSSVTLRQRADRCSESSSCFLSGGEPHLTHLHAAVQHAVQEVQQVLLRLHSARGQEVAIIGQIHHNECGHNDLTVENNDKSEASNQRSEADVRGENSPHHQAADVIRAGHEAEVHLPEGAGSDKSGRRKVERE